MAFREVEVQEIRDVLRAWLAGAGLRKVAEPVGADRKTARRYNASAIVAHADAVNPRLTAGWLDYAQARGFATDAARVRSPKDKPKVERAVQYVPARSPAGKPSPSVTTQHDGASIDHEQGNHHDHS